MVELALKNHHSSTKSPLAALWVQLYGITPLFVKGRKKIFLIIFAG